MPYSFVSLSRLLDLKPTIIEILEVDPVPLGRSMNTSMPNRRPHRPSRGLLNQGLNQYYGTADIVLAFNPDPADGQAKFRRLLKMRHDI